LDKGKVIKLVFSFCIFFMHNLEAYSANKINYWKVHQMPKSIEKDYYIWRLLNQKNISKVEAKNIIKEVFHINKKLRVSYKNKTGLNIPEKKLENGTVSDTIWRRRSRANKYFATGLNLLQKNKNKLAASYFDAAKKNYIKRYEQDKALFWLYLSTKNIAYLKKLYKSYHPNIYTLIAADTVKGRYPKTITQQIRRKSIAGFDIKNPISWVKIKEKMKHYSDIRIGRQANKYASQETIGIYTFLKAKASKHTKAYFPMPYREVMKKLPLKRQALIYAIARQESRFVTASVSPSFALGMMQFMPFLIKDIAKRKKQNIDLDDIFDPYKSIEYANFHLKYLEKYLKHPLFIAYAYNGGIGFTRKYLRNSQHFRNGKYEPYMSMEMMKNIESREYGKKVLSNYVIYMNKLGATTRIFSLLKILTTPQKTDTFRK